ncbi:MAG: tyrosine-type recombinase/integrase [Chloroflexi bacterium]|nr:tyrosine-type recombinase/integrase [Chloroflexota bacterium]
MPPPYLSENWIHNYSDWLQAQDKSKTTIKNYQEDLKRFCWWFARENGRPFSPGYLTPTDLQLYRAFLLGENYRAATINRHLASLRSLAAWAVKTGVLALDPSKDVRGVGQQLQAPKWLDRSAQFALLQAVERGRNAARTPTQQRTTTRDYALIVFTLNTGLRVSELCALVKADLHITARKGVVEVRKGKGSKQRTIPLNKKARAALATWLPLLEGDRVFPLQRAGVHKRVRLYAGRAELDECSAHTLRHSFAKNLINQGVNIEQVASLLGHSKLETTRLYTLPGAHDLQKAVDRL